MSERLDIKDLLKVIDSLQKAGFEIRLWETLGMRLGLYPNTLSVIKINERDEVEGRFKACLSKWLKRVDNVDKVGKPSLSTLADALDKMNGCIAQAEYIRGLIKGDSSEEKPANSTNGGAQASAGIEETDGPAPQGGSLQSEANKQQNTSSSFTCYGWIILPLCIAAVAIFVIYSPSYLPMKVKKCVTNNNVYPEDVKPLQAPLPTTASDKQLDISDLSEIISKLKECKFDSGVWDALCLDIGLYEVTISAIRSDESCAHNRLKSCLVKWLNRVDDVEKKGGATWESLENGLINIGQKPVAEKFRESRKN